jgi:hypothetical protein
LGPPWGHPWGSGLVPRSMGGQEKNHQFSLLFNLQIDQNINFVKLPSVKWLFFACFKL